jgi:acyl-CoA thioester hydrolase
VLFGDTDAAGVVYHANYLRWCEAGRGELMRQAGVPLPSLMAKGIVTPVIDAQLRYLRPVRYDDIVEVVTWVERLRAASVTFAQVIEVEGQRVALARISLACLGKDMRPARVPLELDCLKPPL